MSTILNDDLLAVLKSLRLLSQTAEPQRGYGNRRSRSHGIGLEFEDFKDFESGDEVKYIDHNVLSRLGKPVVRRYSTERQLKVTVLVDASESMDWGQPSKFTFASLLAEVLARIALYGGDSVQVGVATAGGLHFHPRVQTSQSLRAMLAWLASVQPKGRADFEAVAPDVGQTARGGMLILISDFMIDELESAMRIWNVHLLDLVAIQILSPEEVEPVIPSGQNMQLVDSENNAVVSIHANASMIDRYRAALNSWQDEIKATLEAGRSRWCALQSDDDLLGSVLPRWQEMKLVR